MLKLNMRLLLVVACLGACFGVAAADTIEEVWTCTVEEGKTIEDVKAANRRWLMWVNANAGDGKVRSSVATSVVGNTAVFLFVDSFPDLATWAAAKKALDTEEGQAAEANFEGISDCTENRLYNLSPVE